VVQSQKSWHYGRTPLPPFSGICVQFLFPLSCVPTYITTDSKSRRIVACSLDRLAQRNTARGKVLEWGTLLFVRTRNISYTLSLWERWNTYYIDYSIASERDTCTRFCRKLMWSQGKDAWWGMCQLRISYSVPHRHYRTENRVPRQFTLE
jgi:hypothetical protein